MSLLDQEIAPTLRKLTCGGDDTEDKAMGMDDHGERAVADAPIPGLLITGAVGVGKTAIAFEVSEILEARGMDHAFVDAELVYRYPLDDGVGQPLDLRILDEVWSELSQTRPERLTLTRVVESDEHLAGIRDVLSGVELRVVTLAAPWQELRERISQRELGSGHDWHLRRAAELMRLWETRPIEGHAVGTGGRSVRDIATEVLLLSGWIER